MRILSASVTNFASYKELAFDFTQAGLTLIQGATGSGKSTLCDVIPWILFGKTAKDGSVDEIRSWNNDESTSGTITLLLNDKMVQVGRTRGAAKDNDLIIWEDGGAYRGKDLVDTQKLINSLLGIDSDLYLSGAYFHEFSQTAQFFTSTAKSRRIMCEQIVDLSLAKKLQTSIADKNKSLRPELANVIQKMSSHIYELDAASRWKNAETIRANTWEKDNKEKWSRLETKYLNFEDNKCRKLKELERLYEIDLKALRATRTCGECGAPKKANDKAESPYKEQIEREKLTENNYMTQLVDLKAENNPFDANLKDYTSEIEELKVIITSLKEKETQLTLELDDMDLLESVIDDYRSASIVNTIQYLESKTNDLLSTHFDAEIRVNFEVVDADKLDVTIYKDSNECSYTQLSKGQRCLLKLCFGVAAMKRVADHKGIKFHQIFFDEALSGLDDNLKTKAYGLFQGLALEYESIYIVEHSTEFKALLNNSYNVQLVNGMSQIEKA